MEPWLYILDDPGVPEGQLTDPFAGLDESMATELMDALEQAWGIIANAGVPQGDWRSMSSDWQEAAARFRDTYHGFLQIPVHEAKAIGTARVGGDLAVRDARLRAHWPSSQRYHVRQASTNVIRDLDPVQEEAARAIGTLLRNWLGGATTFERLELESAKRWREAYERTREIGRTASGIERMHPEPAILHEEETWFRSAVREELRFWHLFLQEWKASLAAAEKIDEDEIREKAIDRVNGRGWERFNAYLRALRFMYESARILALPDNTLIYWMGPKPVAQDPNEAGHICGGCTYMMERSPFPKNRLPAVPRDGSTACLTNCRHRIVVRLGRSLNEVADRARALPTREAMVQALRVIKDSAHRPSDPSRRERAHAHARATRATGRPHVHNPFHKKAR
jgi:hypothetical protein